MGTGWSAHLVDPPESCEEEIEAVLTGVIAQMSNWDVTSDISRFNRTPPGTWTTIPADMMHVLRAGLDMARLSNGAFDPAIGHVVAHWGFGPPSGGGATPAPWKAIELRDNRARRLSEVALDFSGIAKGFAVDAVSDRLKAMGIANYLLEIGGELRGQGIKPDMQPWWVDVEAPPDMSVPTLRIALANLSVATSGDYRRFRVEDGQRLSHSIDPASQRPIANGVASVTVLHDSAMWADAWATAITVMGAERGLALATRNAIAARLVMRDGDRGIEYMTPVLAAMLD